MKVYVIGPRWWGHTTEYIEKAFKLLGHQTRTFYYLPSHNVPFKEIILNAINSYFKPLKQVLNNFKLKEMNNMNENLAEEVLKYEPELVFVYMGETIRGETLAKIKNLKNTKIVLWWSDNPISRRSVIEAVPFIDDIFVFDSYYIPGLKEMGFKNVHVLPCACDSDVFKKSELSEKEIKYYEEDISFIGDYYPNREEILSKLTEFNLKIWGKNWKKSGLKKYVIDKGIISHKKLPKIYLATKINININHVQSVNGTNNRTFEVASCGGFQLTDYKSDLKNMFKLNEEIVAYKNIDDLKDLIRYYLKHPEERKEISEKSMNRVRNSHTYFHRMKEVLEVMKV